MKGIRMKVPKNHADWLEQRRGGITGTDIAGLMGVSNYKSPLSIYVDKTHAPVPEEPSEAMMLGTFMEDTIAQYWLSKRAKYKLRKINTTIKHPDHDWCRVNIDRHIVAPKEGLLEVKLVGLQKASDWKDDEVPEEYLLQCAWQMLVTGLDHVHLSALVGGTKHIERVVEYNPELNDALFEMAHDFWHNHVLTRIPPAIDGSEATSSAILRMFSGPDAATSRETMERIIGDDKIDLGYEADRIVRAYAETSTEIKTLTDWRDKVVENFIDEHNSLTAKILDATGQKNTFANELKMKIGLFESAFTPNGGKVTWKTTTTKRIDTDAIKKNYPHIYEAHSKESTSRRLLVKPPKE